MFGKKQISYSSNVSNEYNQNPESPNNKFIFYNSEEQFQHKIEFYAILSSNPSKKILTIIDTNISLEYLQIKIAETFEQFPEYKNLDGLKAVNIYKKKTDNTKIILPMLSESDVSQYITNGDFVYCDLISDEYWLQCSVQMKTKHDNLYFAFQYQMRVKKRMTCFLVKSFIMKLALDQWSDFISKHSKKEKTNPKKYYVYQVLFSSNDLRNLDDNSSVNNLFHFNSEIKCNITLISFEDHLFLLLKKINPNPHYNTKLKWVEFKEMTYYLFERSPKYQKEYKWVKMYIKKMINLHKRTNWYVYINLRNIPALGLVPDDSVNESIISHHFKERTSDSTNVINDNNTTDDSNVNKNRNKLLVVLVNDNESSYYLDNLLKDFGNSNNRRKTLQKPALKSKRPFGERHRKTIDTKSVAQVLSYKSDPKDNILMDDTDSNENVYPDEQNQTFINKSNILRSQLQRFSAKDASSVNQFSQNKKQKGKSAFREDFDISFRSNNFERSMMRSRKTNKMYGFQQKSFASILQQYRMGSNYCNLCSEFMKYCTKDYFIHSIKPMYEIKNEFGYLERLVLPETRGFEEVEHEDLANDAIMSENTEFIESFRNGHFMFKKFQREILLFVVGFLLATIVWIWMLFKYADILMK